MGNRKGYRIKALLIGLVAIFSVLNLSAQVEQNMYKFGQMLRLVHSYYVDTTNVPILTEKAIVAMLKELDPHSVYISKDEVAQMNEPLQGSFFGIGISFNIFKDTLMVLTTIPGGPSEKVGLRASDRIMEVDGEKIAGIGLKNTDVFKLLKGPKGTVVKLKVKRKGFDELLGFTIIRDKIPINSLDASYMLDDHVGYIKLNRFSQTTGEEFYKAVMELKQNEDFQDLVLDLRGNGGGYLTAAYELADHFLEAYKMIVYTEGTNSKRKEYKSTIRGELEQGKVVILTDESSASASEILAGAIQDWDRGLIIGRRSYGKGLVQNQFPLSDGSMVRLTTAHYYTPSGRCIQRPYEEGVDEYRNDRYERYENGELFSEDSIKFDEELIYKTLQNNRIVYGGGGIMPDIFVPMDTSSHYKYYNELLRKNLVYNKVLDTMDKMRPKYKKKYPDFEIFKKKFKVDDDIVESIFKEGENEEIERDEESVSFVAPLIKRQIKALFARDLFSIGHYYQIMNDDNDGIKKALEVLNDESGKYEKLLADKI